MNNVLIVTNFNAGRKKAVKYKKAVIDFVLKHTKSFKFVDIDEFKEIDMSPFDTIFAMGGDGTVNKVLPFIAGTDKILVIIPCGTANLLAAKLGLSSNLTKTLKIIDKNNIKKIDVMQINKSLSVLRCGFGYDSDIICKTPQSLKNQFGYFAYFIAGIIFALRLKKKEYNMVIDNEEYNLNASCLIVANADNMFKNIVTIGKKSLLDDAIIEIFAINTENPIVFFIEFILIILGIHINSNRAQYIKAKNITIKNNWSISHIDGEKKNFQNDISVSILAKSLNVISKN